MRQQSVELQPTAASCPLCGLPPPPPSFTKFGYPISRCRCGMIYVARVVDAGVLERLYGRNYFTGSTDEPSQGYRGYGDEEALTRRNFADRLALVERCAAKGKLLDIGCAYGFLVAEARARGWGAEGVERSAHAVEAAVAAGLPVVQGDFLTLDRPRSSFAAVTMFDVLEHVADPRPWVRRARELLEPGGVLVIETPDASAPIARVLGQRHHTYTPPNHLSYFTRATLLRLLDEEGFLPALIRRPGRRATVRRVLHRLSAGTRMAWFERVLARVERSGVASIAVPINLGDSVLGVAGATGRSGNR